MFVYRDIPIDAGSHAIQVEFEALPPETPSPPPDAAERIALSWADTLTIEPREIVLIGYDRRTRSLLRVDAGAEPTR